jgi:hypothetical protein
VTMKPGPRLQKSTVNFILIQGPFFKQTSAPAPLFEADLMAELSSVHDRIDDLRDRFLDRIHAPGVPRGVLQQTEFGRYGTSQLGQLRHIADTAETYLSGSLAAGEIEVGKSLGED